MFGKYSKDLGNYIRLKEFSFKIDDEKGFLHVSEVN